MYPIQGYTWSVDVELSSTARKQLTKVPSYIKGKFLLWVDLVRVDGLAAAHSIFRNAGEQGVITHAPLIARIGTEERSLLMPEEWLHRRVYVDVN